MRSLRDHQQLFSLDGGGPVFDFTLHWTNSASSPPSLPSAPAQPSYPSLRGCTTAVLVLRAPYSCLPPTPSPEGTGRWCSCRSRTSEINREWCKTCSSTSCRRVRWSAHSEGGPTPHEGGGTATSGLSLVVVMVMLVEAEAAVTPLMLSDPGTTPSCSAGLMELPSWQEAPGSAPGCSRLSGLTDSPICRAAALVLANSRRGVGLRLWGASHANEKTTNLGALLVAGVCACVCA